MQGAAGTERRAIQRVSTNRVAIKHMPYYLISENNLYEIHIENPL